VGYVAVRGGEEAIRAASQLSRYLRLRAAGDGQTPIPAEAIRDQMRLAVDRVMAEGSLYAPLYAAVALKQAEGDAIEAAFTLRALRSTMRRALRSEVARTDQMRVMRRISAAFKDVPGGQVLGPTRDYAIQLLDFSLLEEDDAAVVDFLAGYTELDPARLGEPRFPRVLDLLRAEGLLAARSRPDPTPPFDVTREALRFPAARSAKLQTLARGETGALMALAYSTMRGHGNIHPVVGELRVGHVPLWVRHPAVDEPLFVGEVLATEAEVISTEFTAGGDGGSTAFSVGYGLCFGHNELKAIAMAILDRATAAARPESPGEDEEFVLLHSDGIESSGFTAHWKLPHYVTFQSELDRLRAARRGGTRVDAPAG
jgi:alpha-D-ribose 1-methylphosphonate 5-triphosphate synthase subunit PhnI